MSQSLRKFARIDDRPLSQWYASFDWLVTVTANEALFGALARASEDGHAAAVDSNTAYLFFAGKHPASEMLVPELPAADLTAWDASSGIDEELGRLRIAYSPHFYHGYFLRGDGCRFEPEDVFIAYNATTGEALSEIARWGFEECGSFFGDRIAELSRSSVEAV
nr:hypothetical protein [Neorhizobium tomejilense]